MSDLHVFQADELAPGTMARVLDGDLDATVQALEALEIPLRHDLALRFLRELQESRKVLDQMVIAAAGRTS